MLTALWRRIRRAGVLVGVIACQARQIEHLTLQIEARRNADRRALALYRAEIDDAGPVDPLDVLPWLIDERENLRGEVETLRDLRRIDGAVIDEQRRRIETFEQPSEIEAAYGRAADLARQLADAEARLAVRDVACQILTERVRMLESQDRAA
jgi:hypothetical protein